MKKKTIKVHEQVIKVEISPVFDVFKEKQVIAFLRGYLLAKTPKAHDLTPKIPQTLKLVWDNGVVSLFVDNILNFTFNPKSYNRFQAYCEVTSSYHHSWLRSASYSHDIIELISNT